MFESENRKSSNQNRKIEIGIIEAEIRIEATQLTRRIVTALTDILRNKDLIIKFVAFIANQIVVFQLRFREHF